MTDDRMGPWLSHEEPAISLGSPSPRNSPPPRAPRASGVGLDPPPPVPTAGDDCPSAPLPAHAVPHLTATLPPPPIPVGGARAPSPLPTAVSSTEAVPPSSRRPMRSQSAHALLNRVSPASVAPERPTKHAAKKTREDRGKGKGRQRDDAEMTEPEPVNSALPALLVGNEGRVGELRARLDRNIDTVHHENRALRADFETHCVDFMGHCAESADEREKAVMIPSALAERVTKLDSRMSDVVATLTAGQETVVRRVDRCVAHTKEMASDVKTMTALVAELRTLAPPATIAPCYIADTDGPPAKRRHVLERNATPGPSAVPNSAAPNPPPMVLPAVRFPDVPTPLQSATPSGYAMPMQSAIAAAPSPAAPMQLGGVPAPSSQPVRAPPPPMAPLPAPPAPSAWGRGRSRHGRGRQGQGATSLSLGPLSWGTDVRGEFTSLKALMPNNYRLPEPFEVVRDERAGREQFLLLRFRTENDAHRFVSIWGTLRTAQYKKVTAEVILHCTPLPPPLPAPAFDSVLQDSSHMMRGMDNDGSEGGGAAADEWRAYLQSPLYAQ
jgi:hypothetical protein